MKYCIVGRERKIVEGKEYNLYRIQAMKNFSGISTGEQGGLISSFSCLSQDGNCWLDEKSIAIDSYISGNVFIKNSIIINNSNINGDKQTIDNSTIDATIILNTSIFDSILKGCIIENINMISNSTFTDWSLCSPIINYFNCHNKLKNEILVESHGILFHRYNDALRIDGALYYLNEITTYWDIKKIIDKVIEENDFYDEETENDFREQAFKIISSLLKKKIKEEEDKELPLQTKETENNHQVMINKDTHECFIFNIIATKEEQGKPLYYIAQNPFGPGEIEIDAERFVPYDEYHK